MTSWNELETERKYSVTPARASAFAAESARWLRPRIYDPARPIAYARTTYLDTDDLSYLRSAEGAVRQRLRLREYAAAAAPGSPAELTGVRRLELKMSAGGRRAKTELASTPDAIERELAELDVSPRLLVWYRRLSLGDADRLVRVTVDTEIEFSRAGDDGEVVAGPPCILEVKCRGSMPGWLAALVEPFGEPERLSKYELGMAELADVSSALG